MLKLVVFFFTLTCLEACDDPKPDYSGSDFNHQKSSELMDSNNLVFPSLSENQKMDTVFFWKILDYAFANSKFDSKRKEELILKQLVKLTPAQIQDFEIIFQQMNQKSSTWKNLAALSIITGFAADDDFYYFRCWLISLGKRNFDQILANPDVLADLDIPLESSSHIPYVDFEELIPISDQAYGIVTGKTEEDESFPRAVAVKKGLFYDSGTELLGLELSEKETDRIFPKLKTKYIRKN